jgi:esterase
MFPRQDMTLHYREYGVYQEGRESLILLHGFLGSSSNWHGIARKLAGDRHLIVPDLRNHGRSFHDDGVGYPALAGDLADLMDEQGLDSAVFIGHSMGGKAAMWLALERPELVSSLVVVDIAPVSYPNRFGLILDTLNELELEHLESRAQADRLLAGGLNDPGLRQYLLQNLHLADGRWAWRINLPALSAGINAIVGFSPAADTSQYLGPTLFLYGGLSDYVLPEYRGRIESLFPYARMRSVPGAGHWVYSENPQGFLDALLPFLKQVR